MCYQRCLHLVDRLNNRAFFLIDKMKKVIFVIIGIILLSVSSHGQWYSRRYGVSDLNELTQEQLNLALTNVKFEFASGIFLSVVGAAGLYGGIRLNESVHPGDQGRAFTAVFIIGTSIMAEIAGWILLTINITRIDRIKEVMKSKELHLGLMNFQTENMFSDSHISVLPCLSLTIPF